MSGALSATAGALTNAAFERDTRVREGVPTTRSPLSGRWLIAGVAAVVVVGLGVTLVLRSGAEDEAASAVQSAQPQAEVKGAATTVPAAEAVHPTEPAQNPPAPGPAPEQPAAPPAEAPSPAASGEPSSR